MKINLGTDICFALKRWPNPDEWIDIVKNELGLTMIEFDSDFLDPLYNRSCYREVAREIKELLVDNGVHIHNYFTGDITHSVNFLTHPDDRLKKDSFDWCVGAIEIASLLGAKGLGANFNNIPYSSRKDLRKYVGTIKTLLKDILELSKKSKEKDLEFLMWEQMYAPSEMPYRINQARGYINYLNSKSEIPIKLVIDLGHMCCMDFKHTRKDLNPYKWLVELADHIGVVHLQQTTQLKSHHWPFTEKYNKKGIIDPKKVLEALYSTNLSEVNLIFEIFFPINVKDSTVISEMKQTVQMWKNNISSLGS